MAGRSAASYWPRSCWTSPSRDSEVAIARLSPSLPRRASASVILACGLVVAAEHVRASLPMSSSEPAMPRASLAPRNSSRPRSQVLERELEIALAAPHPAHLVERDSRPSPCSPRPTTAAACARTRRAPPRSRRSARRPSRGRATGGCATPTSWPPMQASARSNSSDRPLVRRNCARAASAAAAVAQRGLAGLAGEREVAARPPPAPTGCGPRDGARASARPRRGSRGGVGRRAGRRRRSTTGSGARTGARARRRSTTAAPRSSQLALDQLGRPRRPRPGRLVIAAAAICGQRRAVGIGSTAGRGARARGSRRATTCSPTVAAISSTRRSIASITLAAARRRARRSSSAARSARASSVSIRHIAALAERCTSLSSSSRTSS